MDAIQSASRSTCFLSSGFIQSPLATNPDETAAQPIMPINLSSRYAPLDYASLSAVGQDDNDYGTLVSQTAAVDNSSRQGANEKVPVSCMQTSRRITDDCNQNQVERDAACVFCQEQSKWHPCSISDGCARTESSAAGTGLLSRL